MSVSPSRDRPTVVLTDAKYRSSIAAARSLSRAGFRVIAAQTRAESPLPPPVFSSNCVAEARWLEGSTAEDAFPERLAALLKEYGHPVLLCMGAASLNAAAKAGDRLREAADFLISPPEVLDALNDKAEVHRRCLELGIPVPREYEGRPERFPVVIKPHCGEKQGLKAAERYYVAEDEAGFRRALAALEPYDPRPIVQEKVEGDGAGASLLLGREGELLGAIYHRRIREYPIGGGPSTCCESVYDADKVRLAHRLLASFGFQGLAMVEFKGNRVLEVNPRIWGSFPLTACAGSPLAVNYARASAGERISYAPEDYAAGVRMRFLLNDSAALLSLLTHGKAVAFLHGLGDLFRAREALSDRRDPAPFRVYLRQTLLHR